MLSLIQWTCGNGLTYGFGELVIENDSIYYFLTNIRHGPLNEGFQLGK